MNTWNITHAFLIENNILPKDSVPDPETWPKDEPWFESAKACVDDTSMWAFGFDFESTQESARLYPYANEIYVVIGPYETGAWSGFILNYVEKQLRAKLPDGWRMGEASGSLFCFSSKSEKLSYEKVQGFLENAGIMRDGQMDCDCIGRRG